MLVHGHWYVHTNRHPNTDGTPWGWVDEAVRIADNPYSNWASKEIAVWSGTRQRAEWSDKCAKHNAEMIASKGPV